MTPDPRQPLGWAGGCARLPHAHSATMGLPFPGLRGRVRARVRVSTPPQPPAASAVTPHPWHALGPSGVEPEADHPPDLGAQEDLLTRGAKAPPTKCKAEHPHPSFRVVPGGTAVEVHRRQALSNSVRHLSLAISRDCSVQRGANDQPGLESHIVSVSRFCGARQLVGSADGALDQRSSPGAAELPAKGCALAAEQAPYQLSVARRRADGECSSWKGGEAVDPSG